MNKLTIAHDLRINASAETIYQAVATQKGITGWWSKECSVGENEGESSVLNFDKQGTKVQMSFQTIELKPTEKVVWECIENPNPAWLETQVITEIEELEKSCKVQFSHAGFDEKWSGAEPFEMTKQGWEHFVASLKSFCESGEGQPW